MAHVASTAASHVARDEAPSSSRRARASAPTVAARGSSDRPLLPMVDAPEWCVDRKTGMRPTSTLELLTQLASGDLDPSTRVWREGMECWLPAREVRELALILSDSLTPPPHVVEAQEPARRPRAAAFGLGWALAGAAVGAVSVLLAIELGPDPLLTQARAELSAALAPLVQTARETTFEAVAPVGSQELQGLGPRRAEPGQHRLPRTGQR